MRQAETLNGGFADVPALAAVAQRRLGQPELALAAAERALALDPMHFMAAREKTLALQALARPSAGWDATRASIMRGAVQNAIELATAYAEAGLFADADAVLGERLAGGSPGSAGPMLHYLRGSFRKALGDDAAAAGHFRDAAAAPLAGAFPHRLVEKQALEEAVAAAPSDASAHHLLGNLLYGLGQKPEGLRQWQEAVRLDERLALAWRNVGYAESQLHRDDRGALAAYDKAFALDPTDARVLLERDQVAERLRVPASERRALLDRHRATVDGRDDLVSRWIDLVLETAGGARPRRGGARPDDAALPQLGRGLRRPPRLGRSPAAAGRRALARETGAGAGHYQRAFEYPKNLEVAPRTPDLRAHVRWSLARAQQNPEQAAT